VRGIGRLFADTSVTVLNKKQVSLFSLHCEDFSTTRAQRSQNLVLALEKVRNLRWTKKGLVYCPRGDSEWARHSALQPTPYLTQDGTLRVFVGLRDDQGISRVGFVDVEPDNPSRVLRVSRSPLLDIGEPGAFDDNGVVPCAIVERGEQTYLYYAGYQLGRKVRFLAFGGLAVSRDGGDSFVRYSKVPVVDRADEGLFFRAVHSVLFENGVYRVWYGTGSSWIQSGDKTLPVYNIRHMVSKDGINFPRSGVVCVETRDDEYRVGRPFVVKQGDKYSMFYSVATRMSGYRLGYAESDDGIHWSRRDDKIGLDVSDNGWDSQMIAYSSLVNYKHQTYLFYNGNEMGRTGFGYAVLEKT